MSNVISIKGTRAAPQVDQSRMETLIITPAVVAAWKIPPFQRPLRINEKLRTVIEQIKRNQTVEGVITLGALKGALYVVDGQHRIEGFKLSEVSEAIADVRIIRCESFGDMADEFVRQNSQIAKLRPDDILRGLESSTPALGTIRKHCDFVGYDQIRRQASTSPILGMSVLIRCWTAASRETPSSSATAGSAATLAAGLDTNSVQHLIQFLNIAHAAWGRDAEYHRLWGALNLTMCMWLWNRLVIDRDRAGTRRYAVLSAAEFKHCLMSISASGDYLAWLQGRNLNDRDRSPCYSKIKAAFARRLKAEGKPAVLPAPAWASK